MTIVLDSGAIIAAERNDLRFATIIGAAREDRLRIIAPTTVIAETWRGPKTHPRIARFFGSIDEIRAFDLAAAQRTGTLLALADTASVVDGSVVELAIAHRPSTIVTSDPNDMLALLRDADVSCELLPSRNRRADVLVLAV